MICQKCKKNIAPVINVTGSRFMTESGPEDDYREEWVCPRCGEPTGPSPVYDNTRELLRKIDHLAMEVKREFEQFYAAEKERFERTGERSVEGAKMAIRLSRVHAMAEQLYIDAKTMIDDTDIQIPF